MSRLRTGLPHPVALCSYRFPSYHRNSWREFLEKSDLNMPSLLDARSQPRRAAGRCVQEFQAMTPSGRSIQLERLFQQSGWQSTSAEVLDFSALPKLNLSMPVSTVGIQPASSRMCGYHCRV
jgi:hypothetical protein